MLRITIEEIDSATADVFRAELSALDGDDPAVVDFSEVSFIGSTGLGVVVAVARTLREQGRSLQVVNAGDHVRRVFEITGLEEFLDGSTPRADADDTAA
jgi:anti-sigma B factor antagonist